MEPAARLREVFRYFWPRHPNSALRATGLDEPGAWTSSADFAKLSSSHHAPRRSRVGTCSEIEICLAN